MNDKLSIILILSDSINVHDTLESITNQTFTNWEVFILTRKKIDISAELNRDKYHIIKVNDNDSVFNNLIKYSTSLPGNFITFLTNGDSNSSLRYEKQISFMKSHELNICSCLEMPVQNSIHEKKALTESNSFINADEINLIISASYLPLDLYTFIIRKSFLEDICSYSSHYTFDSEIDLILYFLKFEKIPKLPEILYFVKKSRLPYKESLNYNESPNTDNKLAIFNMNKSIENQSYFKEIISAQNKVDLISNKYKYTIASILDSVNIGGTESYIINIANRLKKENIQMCIITNRCYNREIFDYYNIPLYIADFDNEIEMTDLLSRINEIRLVVIHMDKDLHLCPLIKAALNVPILLTIHGIYYEKKKISIYLNYIDQIIFVSAYAEKYYRQLLEDLSFDNYLVIPNSMETCTDSHIQKNILRTNLNIDKNSIILLYCSRLSYNKSSLALLFLKSFKIIARENKNIYAVIIGNGNFTFSIENLCRDINNTFNENERVFLLGNRFDMLSYYTDSDLVIGTGRVAIEAMSCGKPVISFGSNGDVNLVHSDNIKTLICSNFGDHSFNPKDFDNELIIRKLTKYMTFLINSMEKREKLGLWNKSYIKDHLNSSEIVSFYINKCED